MSRGSPDLVRRSRRLCAALALTLVGWLCLSGCGDSSPVVARVFGSGITLAELRHWTSVRNSADRDGPADEPRSRRESLRLLILSRWLLGQARELGMEVSQHELNAQLGLLRFDMIERRAYEGLPSDPELSAFLQSSGLSVSDRRWLMKLSIVSRRLEGVREAEAARKVTGAQVAAYYVEHRGQLVSRETRDIESIMTKREAGVREAKRELEEGTPFRRVLKLRNVSSEGGLHVALARGLGEPPFEKVVFAARPHILLGPVKQQLYYIFEILKVTRPRVLTLTQATPAIRRVLTRRALGRSRRIIESRWQRGTSCAPGYSAANCG